MEAPKPRYSLGAQLLELTHSLFALSAEEKKPLCFVLFCFVLFWGILSSFKKLLVKSLLRILSIYAGE